MPASPAKADGLENRKTRVPPTGSDESGAIAGQRGAGIVVVVVLGGADVVGGVVGGAASEEGLVVGATTSVVVVEVAREGAVGVAVR